MRRKYLNLTEFSVAQTILQKQAELLLPPRVEQVAVGACLGRVTSAPVFATISHPNYNAAAMDGIALNAELSAGAHERNPLKLRRAVDYWPVDTGDCLPSNCNAVVMIEDVVELDRDTVEISEAVYRWQNVRVVGEDIIIGDMILPSNHCIQPVDIGALLSGGVSEIIVRQKLIVAIVPTGSEVRPVAAGGELQPGEIIDSNSGMLAAMISEAGAIPQLLEIVPDDKSLLKEAFLAAAGVADIVVVIAGSSAGSEDYTQPLFQELGAVFVHGIAMKPGKPAVIGKIVEKLAFGIPGYPVAAFMIARELLQPIIHKHSGVDKNEAGATSRDQVAEAQLSRRLISSIKHQEFVQVKLGQINGKIIATPLNRGAGITMSLVKADGILVVPRALEGYEAGTRVEVQLLRPLAKINNSLICTGSHDIIIDKLNDELSRAHHGWTMSSAHVGSLGGIMAIKRGETHLAPVHILDELSGEYNISFIKKYLRGRPVVLIRGIKRQQGLYFRKHEHLEKRTLALIAEHSLRFANRQQGSGTRVLFDYQLKQARIPATVINGSDQEWLTHTAVAIAVLSQNCDTGMGIEAVANLLGLDFVPIGTESYDLIVPQEYITDVRIQELLTILQSEHFKTEIGAIGGYTIDNIELLSLNFA